MNEIEKPIRKGQFAKHCNVSPARVSQWISEGKIFGEALTGEGRAGRIRPCLAIRQLRERLDPRQIAGNGIATNLQIPPLILVAATDGDLSIGATPVKSAPWTLPSEPDEIGNAIRREQLEALQRKNRRETIEEAASSGRFTDAEMARQEMGRIATRLVTGFEAALPELAAAVAGQFKVAQRDVLHTMRGAYREVRAKQSDVARSAAESLPELIATEVGSEYEAQPGYRIDPSCADTASPSCAESSGPSDDLPPASNSHPADFLAKASKNKVHSVHAATMPPVHAGRRGGA